MGSQVQTEDEFTVLVTGFAPFKAAYPVNPAWEIASRLPSYLPTDMSSSSVHCRPQTSKPALPPVRILTYPEPVRVNYQTVRALVPKLWDTTQDGSPSETALREKPRKIDLCIHIGMADPRLYYSIERRGHRDGYTMPDVDGEKLYDDDRRRLDGDKWIWAGVPSQLETDLDVGDVLGRWREHSPSGSDLRISEDAGRYLCDFIYFSSLAHLYKHHEHRRVVFLHVPSDASESSVTKGRDLTVHLIRALVESELDRNRKAEIQRDDKIAVELRA